MAVQPQYLEYVLEQLAALGSLRSHRMFGGIGLYSRELFFGLIDDDTLYFKTGESNIAEFRARNMPRFMPFPDRAEVVLGYHQVPADVIEDAEQLVAWARQAVAVALTAQTKTARPRQPKANAKAKAKAKGKAKAKARRKSKTPRKAKARRR